MRKPPTIYTKRISKNVNLYTHMVFPLLVIRFAKLVACEQTTDFLRTFGGILTISAMARPINPPQSFKLSKRCTAVATKAVDLRWNV
jgi:hypothetical protein